MENLFVVVYSLRECGISIQNLSPSLILIVKPKIIEEECIGKVIFVVSKYCSMYRVAGSCRLTNTLQRHNTENSKQKFLEKGIARGQSQFPLTCVCEWLVYSQGSVSLFCCRKICGPILGIYCINHWQKLECGNWDWGRAIPFLGIHNGIFFVV